MIHTLGRLADLDLVSLAQVIAPRDRIAVVSIETEGGWRTYGFRGAAIIWEGGADLDEGVSVLTLFAATDGKYTFQRSHASSTNALEAALVEMKQGRQAVVQCLVS